MEYVVTRGIGSGIGRTSALTDLLQRIPPRRGEQNKWARKFDVARGYSVIFDVAQKLVILISHSMSKK
jgi:hypothetical protein